VARLGFHRGRKSQKSSFCEARRSTPIGRRHTVGVVKETAFLSDEAVSVGTAVAEIPAKRALARSAVMDLDRLVEMLASTG
jgi:hypothetical protein